MTEVGESTTAPPAAGAGAAERGAGWAWPWPWMTEQKEDGVSGRTTGSGDEDAEGEAGGEEESAASGMRERSSGMARGSE